jgi:hypothetical protein
VTVRLLIRHVTHTINNRMSGWGTGAAFDAAAAPSPGRHCHFSILHCHGLALAAIDCHCVGIYAVILLSLLSFLSK